MGLGKRGNVIKILAPKARGVTPEQAISLLQKKGVKVDGKEAEVILDFLYFLAKLAVNQYFNDK